VRYLLDGTLRRLGAELRITAQIVKAEDGDVLWAQKFDGRLAELPAAQEDLASEMAAHIVVQIEGKEFEHALKKADDITDRDAMLRAFAVTMGYPTRASWAAGVAELKRAVELNPRAATVRSWRPSKASFCTIAAGMILSSNGRSAKTSARRARSPPPMTRQYSCGLRRP
jgi:hypothetical protein